MSDPSSFPEAVTADGKPPSGALGGKVAIVTGASRGIGEAIARAFAREGASVVLASRTQADLDTVAASIRADGGTAVAIACHAGEPDTLDSLFDRTVAELGRLDILVNNAATNPYFGTAMDAPEWAFDKTVAVNMKGYFIATQRGAQRMVAHGGGSIINVASILGLKPAPMQVIYAMTKAAVISMTKGFAQELGSQGVRVNAIAPGLIETKFASALIDDERMHRGFIEQTPLRRHGQPEEIAGAAVYLASDASSFTTGSVLVADGGFMS